MEDHDVGSSDKWYLLGCYFDYKQAVRTRQLIVRLVTNDDPRIIFDPRVEINNFLPRSVSKQISGLKKKKKHRVTMIPTIAAASKGSLIPTSILSNNSSSSSSSIVRRPIPAAHDTAPLILGRVRRATDEKLALLRVRRCHVSVYNYHPLCDDAVICCLFSSLLILSSSRDVCRMQWVIETDSRQVEKIANRHRRQTGISPEQATPSADQLLLNSRDHHADRTSSSSSSEGRYALPDVDEVLDKTTNPSAKDLISILSSSKEFSRFTVFSRQLEAKKQTRLDEGWKVDDPSKTLVLPSIR